MLKWAFPKQLQLSTLFDIKVLNFDIELWWRYWAFYGSETFGFFPPYLGHTKWHHRIKRSLMWTDRLKLTGQNLGRVFMSCMYRPSCEQLTWLKIQNSCLKTTFRFSSVSFRAPRSMPWKYSQRTALSLSWGQPNS